MPRYTLLPSNADAVGNERPGVDYRRELCDDERLVDDPFLDPVSAQASYRAWLVAVGGPRTRAACARVLQRTVHTRSNAALRHAVRGQKRIATADFRAMVGELRRRHLLRSEQAQRLRPRFTLDLIDHRGDTARPLPDPEWLLETDG